MNRIMLKKLLPLLLIVCSLLFCVNAYGEDGAATIFDTVLLKVADNNAKEWMSSESNRAFFATLAFLDAAIQEGNPFDIESFASSGGPIYVGRSGFIVSAMFCDSDNAQSLSIALDTRDNSKAGYSIFPFEKTITEKAIEQTFTDGYYKVDIVDFWEALQAIQEALQD